MQLSSYLTSNELAERWNKSAKTLANWRSEERGPVYEKKGCFVLYQLKDILDYEKQHPHLALGRFR